jgi:hypothetical protein
LRLLALAGRMCSGLGLNRLVMAQSLLKLARELPWRCKIAKLTTAGQSRIDQPGFRGNLPDNLYLILLGKGDGATNKCNTRWYDNTNTADIIAATAITTGTNTGKTSPSHSLHQLVCAEILITLHGAATEARSAIWTMFRFTLRLSQLRLRYSRLV